MRNLIIGITLGLMTTAYASYFKFNSQKTVIGGKVCIVVQSKMGVGVSCNWGR